MCEDGIPGDDVQREPSKVHVQGNDTDEIFILSRQVATAGGLIESEERP